MVGFILLLGLTTITVYAAFFTINTNDDVIDSNWPATLFRTDPADVSPAKYDILNFWVGSDADPPGNYYFRAELSGSMEFDTDLLEARLDCDNDGYFDDEVDIWVDYTPSIDQVDVYKGDSSLLSSEPASTKGEQIGSTPNYEWMAPTTGWSSSCSSGAISIVLVTMDIYGGVTDIDTISVRGYYVPTMVSLAQLQGRTERTNHGFLIGSSILGVFLLGLSLFVRLKR